MRKIFQLIASAALLTGASNAWTAECPFVNAEPSDISGPLVGKGVMTSTNPAAVLFHSKMDRDDDGGPQAYHIGLKTADQIDPGLDTICNGGSVLELKDGNLVNKYGKLGSGGPFEGPLAPQRSKQCKQDYINLRDAGFPACSVGGNCMLWFGIADVPRDCGFPYSGGSNHCGFPIRQKNPNGTDADFYLTTTSLHRPGAPSDTRNQSDYINASVIPYIVMPGGQKLPGGMTWKDGDFALVAWHNRIIGAVVGDTGPGYEIGEGSRALLKGLRGGKSAATIDESDPVTIILMPGTSAKMTTEWPIQPATLDKMATSAMKSLGGLAALLKCPGLQELK